MVAGNEVELFIFLFAYIGLGNLFLTSAIEMAGISFQKVAKFAYIWNMKFLDKSSYYSLRGDYVYPEIDQAWIENKNSQVS